jgi:hypothetical protein
MKKRNLDFVLTVLSMMMFLLVTLGSASAASLMVNVMPDGVNTPVNPYDSKPYTWPSNNLELWGKVTYDGGLPLTYTWTFGDGSPNATGTVSDPGNIAENHVYASASSFVATLTVTDGTVSDTKTLLLDVAPVSDAVKTNLAIQRSLKYLYRSAIDGATWNSQGYWPNFGSSCDFLAWSDTDAQGDTGLAVLAFEDHGHRAMNDHSKDIYADTVQRGLYTLEAMLQEASANPTPATCPADLTTCTDSDLNGDGLMLYESFSGGNLYHQGILSMAFSNSGTPNAMATCGHNATINAMSYRTILENLVDFTAYAQQDTDYYSGSQGSWRYTANYGSGDNSVSQWPALGLVAAAGSPWNINESNPLYPKYPAWVKTRSQHWLDNSQCQYDNSSWTGIDYLSKGGFGYDSACNWTNIAKTGSGIIANKFAGGGGNMPDAIKFIGDKWATTYWDYGNLGDHYAMYAVKKGLQYAGISTVGGHDWQSEFNHWYLGNQIDNGTNGVYWPESVRIYAGPTTASFGLLVMAPGLVELPPVANAGPAQQVPPNVTVYFDGSGSVHSDPMNHHIVSYEWDFNYDGTTFNVSATGIKPSLAGGYSLAAGQSTRNVTVGLRVTDDNSPPLTAIATTTITVNNGNVAPTAKPGGPYLCAVGQNITLDGSGSSDPNACTTPGNPTCLGDSIVKYEWDFGTGNYQNLGVKPTFPCTALGTQNITLRVTDSFGVSATQSSQATTVAVSNLQPVCFKNTINSYNRLTGLWTVGWQMKLKNSGTGPASAISANLTPATTSALLTAGLKVIDASLSWNDLASGSSALSTDDFRYTYPRTGNIDLTKVTFDITFTDPLGSGTHVIRSIPQGSGGTCPP